MKSDDLSNTVSNTVSNIVAQSAFLHERLDERWLPQPNPFDEAIATRRLERWCQVAAGGNQARFVQRLAWDGMDLTSARLLLGTGCYIPGISLPAWANFLAQVIDEAVDVPDQPTGKTIHPFLDAAQHLLAQRVGAQLEWLAPSTQQTLTAYLAERLRTVAPSSLLNGQPLVEICLRYPVLARQLAQRSLDWVTEVEVFLRRLSDDWPALASTLHLPSSLQAEIVSGLKPGLSDPHQGGRTVWRIELAGLVVAYKPKSLQMDQAWAELVKWVAQQGLKANIGQPWMLTRQDYGWMEWVAPGHGLDAHGLAAHRLDAQGLAQDVGAILALLHLLHATDCHAENFSLQGTSPLLLDGEMLVYPQFVGSEMDDPLDVMRTGLLPRWLIDQSEQAGLHSLLNQEGEIAQAEVIQGYLNTWSFLSEAWSELSSQSGTLSHFRQGRVRVVLRPTAAYFRILQRLSHPAFLADGIDFSIETDHLAYAYLNRPDQLRFWPLLVTEHQSIARGDLPLFYGEINCPDLFYNGVTLDSGTLDSGTLDSGTLSDCLYWPPFRLLIPSEQTQQVGLIQASLDQSAYAPPSGSSFLEAACHLGALLIQRAIPGNDHGQNWIALQYQQGAGLWRHAQVAGDVYSGRIGISLFLAGLAQTTGEAHWRDFALAGLKANNSLDAPILEPGWTLYALCLATQLLDAPFLLQRATDLVRRLPAPGIAWGMLDGEAGLVLGLLSLYAQTTDKQVLALAIKRGEQILQASEVWLHPQNALGGFSHGAAGIAYALWQLHQASGQERFLSWAKRGWTFQHNLYDEQLGNWQDRRGKTPTILKNWCNGAAGIGLAGAACIEILPDLQPLTERVALLLAEEQDSTLDTLCCGHFGQIESLLEMGLLWGRQEWIEEASTQARHRLAHAAQMGTFRLYDDLPSHLFNPGFFRGVAGIGYTLLRLAKIHGEKVNHNDKAVEILPCLLRMALQEAYPQKPLKVA